MWVTVIIIITFGILSVVCETQQGYFFVVIVIIKENMEKLFTLGNTPEFITLLDNTVRALHMANNAVDVRNYV